MKNGQDTTWVRENVGREHERPASVNTKGEEGWEGAREGVKRAPRFLVGWFGGGWGAAVVWKLKLGGKGKANVAGRDSRVVAAMPGGRPFWPVWWLEMLLAVWGNDSCVQKRGERERERVFRSSTILTRRRPCHHPFVVYHGAWASWTLKLYSIIFRKFEFIFRKK